MARQIKITDDRVQALYEAFARYVATTKMVDGKVNFQRKIDEVNAKAELRFTEKAWRRMNHLVASFDKEIAWHGSASRVDGEGHVYMIDDIMVYPQTVSGSAVDMDTNEYAKWLMENDEDPRFSRIRFQGHSHVNMGVEPSGTDMSHQQDILDMLRPDDFYIFAIINKSGKRNLWVYDNAINTVFGTQDITVNVDGDVFGIHALDDEVEKLVKKQTYGYGSQYGDYGYPYSYKGYGGQNYGAYQSTQPSVTPTSTSKETAVSAKKESEPDKEPSHTKAKVHTGKKKKKRHSRFYIGTSYGGGYQDDPEDDYNDDPYSAFGCT